MIHLNDKPFGESENIALEFKQFCFKMDPSLIFDDEDIKKCIYKGIWHPDLTDFTIENIRLYFRYYVPKYFSSFSNARINGKFCIGINDDGLLTGIPSKLNITKEMLENILQEELIGRVNVDFSKYMKINIIKIDKSKSKLDKPTFLNQYIEKYENMISTHEANKKEYKYLRQIWDRNVFNNRSLENILNIDVSRKEFYDYLKIEAPHIEIDYSIDKYSMPDFDTLQNHKKNDKNIFYWLIKYKDIKMKKIESCKPKRPKLITKMSISNLLVQITDLNYFYQELEDINHYLIIIDILGNSIPENVKVGFRNYKHNETKKELDIEWKFKKRVLKSNGPCCVTLHS